MKIIAAIPARLASSRFPSKMIADLGGLPLIVQTYHSVRKTQLFDDVMIATEDDLIAQLIEREGGTVFRSQKPHACGSDRIAEACAHSDADVIINIQGDEPFIQRDAIAALIACFQQPHVHVGSLMQPITDPTQIDNPNVVKVVTDLNANALYFSRSPIPYLRQRHNRTVFYRHIGIYGYTRTTLTTFAQHPPTPLEESEQIEAIRFVEMGYKMKMAITNFVGLGIDTAEDLDKARLLWAGHAPSSTKQNQ